MSDTYRPATDKVTLISQTLWEEGNPIIVERDDGIHCIYRR